MKLKLNIVLGIIVVFAIGCTRDWEDHYDVYPETVNENVWNAMQSDSKLSQFVQILKDNQLDTLFQSDIPYTIFAPTNEAVGAFLGTVDTTLLKYHICSHFINSGSIGGKRKIQTLTEKFALFDPYSFVPVQY